MVMLDWSEAFDRIRHDALITALARFGIPAPFLDLVREIYSRRTFDVRDGGLPSEVHHQAAGIAQGCPLSPYLFIIVMTVVLNDALKIRGDVLEKQ